MNRIAHRALTLLLVLGTAGALAQTHQETQRPDSRVEFNIAAQPMAKALNEFATQAVVRIVFYPHTVQGLVAPQLVGSYSAEQGLQRLLANSALKYRFTDERTISVSASELTSAEASPSGMMRIVQSEDADHAVSATSNVMQQANKQGDQSSSGGVGRIEEIVVTAQKRGNESLQDVPIPVTVLSATSLLEDGATGLQDYFSKVPGVSLVSSSFGGTNTVVIRGVATNGVNDNPTVGITVDDAPYGASTFLGGGLQPIDMDPNELSQIEVLRGPQGTLYGASSMGGLLKYVMVDPALDQFSGRVMMSAQGTTNNDGLDYGLRGSVNLPINSSAALRVSGFDRREAGYIDDTFGGKNGINGGHSYGGRAALLWRANDEWSVKLSAVRQLLETDEGAYVDVDPSERLESSDYVSSATGATRSFTLLTGSLRGRISDSDITSITAYTRSDSIVRAGLPRGIFAFFAGLAEPNTEAALYSADQEVSKFSQEVRANIPIGDRVDWLAGAFYTKESAEFVEGLSSGMRATGEEVGRHFSIFGIDPSSLSYSEIAAFTNLTVRFTDRFDMQFGARVGENRQNLSQLTSGFLTCFCVGAPPVALGPVRSTDDAFTYLITPRLKLTGDWMLYSRIASGYRPGGPTFNSQITGGPPELKADTTENYEVGIKGNVFDWVSIDASAYYIDWKDIPTGMLHPESGLGSLVNAGGAVSKGLELAFDLRPLRGLTLSAWGAWADAYIDKLPANTTVTYAVGDRLPYSPRFSGNASIDYEHPIFETMIGNVGASIRYVGDRVHEIGLPASILRSYTQVDAHVGLKSGGWTVNAFINNITDERGRIGGRLFSGPPLDSVLIIRPRTIGISMAREF